MKIVRSLGVDAAFEFERCDGDYLIATALTSL